MTDLEISKQLALAIGWPKEYVSIFSTGKVHCMRNVRQWGWQVFDYRDWAVIGPIAERYDAFPMVETDHSGYHKFWVVYCFGETIDGDFKVEADTPQKAIALAVIQGVKK